MLLTIFYCDGIFGCYREVVAGTAGPLVGARVHPRVSVPPASGSVMAHAALSLTPASG
jgi:hypothetical protein